jgi:hypothetical protein
MRAATRLLTLGVLTVLLTAGCRQLASYAPAANDDGSATVDAKRPDVMRPGGDGATDAQRDLATAGPDGARLDGLLAPDATATDGGSPLDQNPACAIDLNGDTKLDFLDLEFAVNCFGKPLISAANCKPADFDVDGLVDADDLDFLQTQMAACTGFIKPCAVAKRIVQVYGKDTFTCTGTLGANQCSAEASYCNKAGGWALCKVKSFQQKHGTTPTRLVAWLAGCVRETFPASLTAPRDGVCSGCSGGTTFQSTYVSWDCSSGSKVFETDKIEIGVVTASDCQRVGVNTSSAEAHWNARGAANTLTNAAVCCR